MFERYTEKARRTIFFARYEASQSGSSYIETEHLLLGLLREDKALANQFLGSFGKIEALRRSIDQHGNKAEKIPISVDLPLSHECKRVLAYGAEESERMSHKEIGTPHLFLGLLREEQCFAAQLLREQGVVLESAREQVQQLEPSAARASTFVDGLRKWLVGREANGGIWIVEQRSTGSATTHFAIYAGDPPKGGGTQDEIDILSRVPLLCIDIIRGELFTSVQKRCDDFIAEGVREVWVLNPELKRAYTVTRTEGLREFKSEILKIASPPLEMDLRRIFD
jgi:Clp amino terminal domain, pathogenicity island component